MTESGQAVRRELRLGFVGLLFAIVVAAIATNWAKLLVDHGVSAKVLPVHSHLLLSMVVAAASWVGWQESEAVGAKEPIHAVWSRPFAILLIDVALVIAYFSLATEVETFEPNSVSLNPAAEPELRWITFIFLGYVFWDSCTKITLRPKFQIAVERMWQTAVCAVAAGGLYFLLRDAVGHRSVVLVDLALIALVLLFRTLKSNQRNASLLLGLAALGFSVSAFCLLARGP